MRLRRAGEIYQFDLDISEKALLSDQRFIRSYGKYQRWIPVGRTDSIILRAEAGQVFSPKMKAFRKIIYSVPAAVQRCVVMLTKVWVFSIRAPLLAGV
jgi:hypothetical protein